MQTPAIATHTVLCAHPGGLHRMAVHETAPPQGAYESGPPVVCVHGLSRNARDFDALAAYLAAAGRRVLCPDVVGRGDSDRLPVPALYQTAQYAADMIQMLNALGLEQVDWVGTSMGGIIAMNIACSPLSPIRRLVLNDIGHVIPAASLDEIGTFLHGAPAHFADFQHLEDHLRRIHAGFGDLDDRQWRHLAVSSARADGDGWRLHYDPVIAQAIAPCGNRDVDLSALWTAITAPVLILRGAQSNLLTPQIAQAMLAAKQGAPATLEEIAGCGHAPALMDRSQAAMLTAWLNA